jgi:hypothetical protein
VVASRRDGVVTDSGRYRRVSTSSTKASTSGAAGFRRNQPPPACAQLEFQTRSPTAPLDEKRKPEAEGLNRLAEVPSAGRTGGCLSLRDLLWSSGQILTRVARPAPPASPRTCRKAHTAFGPD